MVSIGTERRGTVSVASLRVFNKRENKATSKVLMGHFQCMRINICPLGIRDTHWLCCYGISVPRRKGWGGQQVCANSQLAVDGAGKAQDSG